MVLYNVLLIAGFACEQKGVVKVLNGNEHLHLIVKEVDVPPLAGVLIFLLESEVGSTVLTVTAIDVAVGSLQSNSNSLHNLIL